MRDFLLDTFRGEGYGLIERKIIRYQSNRDYHPYS